MSSSGHDGGERNLEEGYESDEGSVEETLDVGEVPPWTEQITLRSIIASLILGIVFSFIVMRLSLSSGMIPSLNVAAGLLAFFLVKTWTRLIEKLGFVGSPFTCQENTVIQTCVIACIGICYSGGFGSYLLAMNRRFAVGNDSELSIAELGPGSIVFFLFLISFMGLFIIAPMAKPLLIQHNLTFGNGMAVAHLINSFHTAQGAFLAKMQVCLLFKSLASSFFWAGFRWIFAGGQVCGFGYFPIFGMKAFARRFYMDLSLTNVGIGMICPPLINISLFLGTILSQTVVFPYIAGKRGDWYPIGLSVSDMHGVTGYKIFISISMILGDTSYHLINVIVQTLVDIYNKRRQEFNWTDSKRYSDEDDAERSPADRCRATLFLQEQIPTPVAIGGYLLSATAAIVSIPFLFPQVQSYHVAAACLLAPLFAFSNTYGYGLTNWSLCPSYSKLCIFVFAAWVGFNNGGVVVSLVACGVIMSVINSSSDLMQDFRTGYLTLTSPRAMFVGQIIGTAIGCFMAPLVFAVFNRTNNIGEESSEYSAPYAKMYRAIALFGTEGLQALPKHCLEFCIGFFIAAFLVNVVREVVKRLNWRIHKYVPSVTGIAIPFYLGPSVAISMCTGSLVVFLWGKVSRRHAATFSAVVASGMMCGESLWVLPELLMDLDDVHSPICMKFMARETYAALLAQ